MVTEIMPPQTPKSPLSLLTRPKGTNAGYGKKKEHKAILTSIKN